MPSHTRHPVHNTTGSRLRAHHSPSNTYISDALAWRDHISASHPSRPNTVNGPRAGRMGMLPPRTPPQFGRPPTPAQFSRPSAAPSYKPIAATTPLSYDPKELNRMRAAIKDNVDLHYKDLHSAFLDADKDRSGSIDKNELRRALHNWNDKAEGKQALIEAIVNMADANHDGTIDYAEFAKTLAHQHMGKQVFGRGDDETGVLGHVVQNSIAGWGGQVYINDNKASAKKKVFHPDWVDVPLPHAMKGHETATKKELKQEMGMLRDHLNTKYKLMQKAFLAFDEDKSGKIDRNQLEEGIKHFNLPIPHEHVPALLDQMDTDHNGQIDYAEFCGQLRELNTEAPFMEANTIFTGARPDWASHKGGTVSQTGYQNAHHQYGTEHDGAYE